MIRAEKLVGAATIPDEWSEYIAPSIQGNSKDHPLSSILGLIVF